jgi:hypothetical protein
MNTNVASNGAAVRYDRPPVQVSRSGVHSVNPADILRSSVGLSEIREAAADARAHAAYPNGRTR